MATFETSSVRFNKEQLETIETFCNNVICCSHVWINQLANKGIELYTYQEGVNKHSYDKFMRFKNKDFFIGYLQGVIDHKQTDIYI